MEMRSYLRALSRRLGRARMSGAYLYIEEICGMK
jgi:hypothetical protein